MVLMLAGESLALWSVASLGAVLSGAWHLRHVLQHRRDRRAVRERLFSLCQ
jgi:hypothetical protein